MKAYRVPDAPAGSRWQYTQADARAKAKEAGGKFEQLEIPNDSKGRLQHLNDVEYWCERWLLEKQGTLPPTTGDEIPYTDPLPTPSAPSQEPAQCSRCKWDLKSRERFSARVEEGLTIDGVCQWIDKATGGELERLVSSVVTRLTDLRREVA